MKPPFRMFILISTLGILFTLISGCGQKHLHVSTTSGEPGPEKELEAGLDASDSDQQGLGALALSESGLGNQTDSSDATDQDGMSGDAQDPSSQGRGVEKSEAMGQDDPLMAQDFSASEPGQDIQAQSSSQPNPIRRLQCPVAPGPKTPSHSQLLLQVRPMSLSRVAHCWMTVPPVTLGKS